MAQALLGLTRSSGNPSSTHSLGRAMRARLDDARARIAQRVGGKERELVFVGSGSEANALALKGGFARRKSADRNRIVVSAIEHPGLLFAVSQLEALGARVTRVPPNGEGRVCPDAFAAALDTDVAIAALMWANNETGVVQPVVDVASACGALGIPLHVDGVQVVGKLPVRLSELGSGEISLALSAHKHGGPPGIGALIGARKDLVEPLVPGHQERGLRGGTPDVVAAEAMALALDLALEELPAKTARWQATRERFEREATERVPGARVLGATQTRVPNTSLMTFAGVDGPTLLMALDLEGIQVSSGSACASGALSPSHVLLAMGLDPVEASTAVRFSWGRDSDEAEVATVVEALARTVPSASRL